MQPGHGSEDDDEIPELQEVVSQVQTINLDEDSEVEPCPITLLTGFLGSGKTTLLEYVYCPIPRK